MHFLRRTHSSSLLPAEARVQERKEKLVFISSASSLAGEQKGRQKLCSNQSDNDQVKRNVGILFSGQ